MDGAGLVVSGQAGEGDDLLPGLNARQSAFVRHYLAGNNQTKAAELAGYSQPGTDAFRLIRHPQVIRAIHNATVSTLVAEARPLALKHLMDTLLDPSAGRRDKTDAARVILAQPNPLEDKANPKDTFTADQWQKIIQTLEQQANTIDITPDSGTKAPANPLIPLNGHSH